MEKNFQGLCKNTDFAERLKRFRFFFFFLAALGGLPGLSFLTRS